MQCGLETTFAWPSSKWPKSASHRGRLAFSPLRDPRNALKRHGARLPRIVLEKNLDFPFGLLQLGMTKTGELDSFFEQLQRRIQRQVAALQLLDDFFEAFQCGFKIGDVRHDEDCS